MNYTDWKKNYKPWKEHPIGTKARESWTGGYWIKTELGWKWFCGATFPYPGCADEYCPPTEIKE